MVPQSPFPRSARLPDFFIVGAPKCGTTALYTYLGTHPALFLCPVKEPNFFCEPHMQVIRSATQYVSLFEKASKRRLCGEASALYLFWKNPINRILEWNANAKIIALVRNPIEMAVSYHNQVVQTFEEKEELFENAWRRSSSSLRKEDVGPRCRDSRLLDYRTMCRLGEQVKLAKATVPQNQLHIIVFDDLRAKPREVYQRALRFLGVDDDGKSDFPVVNARNRQRSKAVGRLLVTPPRILAAVKSAAQQAFPVTTKKIGRRLLQLNRLPNLRPDLSEQLMAEMIAEFESDVGLLGSLIDRNLRHWCNVGVEWGRRGDQMPERASTMICG